jgi:methyl-accepting chemotaxis protein
VSPDTDRFSGAGFAVVADEVRNLAQRCAQAARDTASMIDESISKSKDGRAKVEHVATAIGVMTGDAAKFKALVDEVSQGSQEQKRGSEQVAQSQSLKDIVKRLTEMVGS